MKTFYLEEEQIIMDAKTQAQIAANIGYLRRLFGYTQTGLAKALDMSRCTYALLENGERLPTADVLLLLSDFYHISVDTILQLDSQKLVNDVIFADRCSKQQRNLLELYNQLSPEGKRKLITRSKQLLLEEDIGEVPSYRTAL